MLGGPFVIALRPALHGALLDAFGIDAIALSTEATGFTANERRVALHVRRGPRAETVEGDQLVGADGVHSVTRRVLYPSEPPPRSRGIVAVRGVVHDAVRHLSDLSGVLYLGPGVESALARANDTGIYCTSRWRASCCPLASRTRLPSWRTWRRGSMRRFAR